jgi:hypothetical protein
MATAGGVQAAPDWNSQGSYSGVMGLPLFETAQLLAAARVPCWSGS